MIAACCFIYYGPFWPAAPRRLWDYSAFVSSASVWVHGGDPYDNDLVNRSWAARSPGLGVTLKPEWSTANAPPTTLVALAPIAVLPATLGAGLWMIGTLALLLYAGKEVAGRAGVRGPLPLAWYFGGLLASGPVTVGLLSGNPIGLAGPLLLIGLARSQRSPGVAAGLLMGIGTALKIQVGLPLVLFVAFCGRWRVAAIAVATLAAIATVGVGRLDWAGVDWLHHLTANINATNRPFGLNDFANDRSSASDFLNFQVPLWQFTHDRLVCNAIAWGLAIAGATILAFLAWHRRDSGRAVWIGLGAAGALSLIPIYHRVYDAIVLLPLFAVAIEGLRRADRRTRSLCIAALVGFLPYLIPGGWPALIERPRALPWLQSVALYRAFFVAIRPWTVVGHAAVALLLLNDVPRDGAEANGEADKSLEKSLLRTSEA